MNVGHDRLLTNPCLFTFLNSFQILLEAITLSEHKVYHRNSALHNLQINWNLRHNTCVAST
jgi:hypothetical protein